MQAALHISEIGIIGCENTVGWTECVSGKKAIYLDCTKYYDLFKGFALKEEIALPKQSYLERRILGHMEILYPQYKASGAMITVK